MSLTVDLSGKRALITGASSGFGAHFAEILAASGAHVTVAARRIGAVGALARRIRDAGGDADAIPLDVRDEASISACVAATGRIDILVNNAGVTDTRPAIDEDATLFDHIVGTNLRGAFSLSVASARVMKAGGGGSIINIASVLGLRQGGQVTAYATSKAALIQLTKQHALEWARYNIRVNALAPGYFATDLNDAFFGSPAGQALIKRVPQRRLGALDDLSGPLLLLASDASRFMTGSVITVDGGHLVSGL